MASFNMEQAKIYVVKGYDGMDGTWDAAAFFHENQAEGFRKALVAAAEVADYVTLHKLDENLKSNLVEWAVNSNTYTVEPVGLRIWPV